VYTVYSVDIVRRKHSCGKSGTMYFLVLHYYVVCVYVVYKSCVECVVCICCVYVYECCVYEWCVYVMYGFRHSVSGVWWSVVRLTCRHSEYFIHPTLPPCRKIHQKWLVSGGRENSRAEKWKTLPWTY